MSEDIQGRNWDRVIHGFLYGVVFLLPLLFTPWTFEYRELSKQTLLYALVSAATITWFLKVLALKKWRFVTTSLDLPILALVTVYFLASIFSADRPNSFLGVYGIFSGSFFSLVFFLLFYYLVINTFETAEQLKKLFSFFFVSVFLATVYVLLQFTGWFVLPLPWARVQGFNTVGTLLPVTVLAALAILLSIGLKNKSIFRFPDGMVWRVILAAAAFVILLTVNFIYAWIALLAGLLVYLGFSLASGHALTLKNFLTPLILTIATASLLILGIIFQKPIGNVFKFNLPQEVRLDYATAMPALKGAIFDRPILGSGPNTFQHVFSQYRDQSFNLSSFWSTRFDKAPSEAAEYLIGTGILGLLIFEIFNLAFIAYAVMFLFKHRSQSAWQMALAAFAGYAVLWTAHWFLFFNTVLAFSFWFTVAVFIAASSLESRSSARHHDFSFASSPRQAVSVISAVSFGLMLIIVYAFFSFSAYAADISYRKGLLRVSDSEAFEEAEIFFADAVKLNRFRSDYFLTYGEYLFGKVNRELARKEPNVGQVQTWLTQGINTARKAVDLAPHNGQVWERLAVLYGYARPLVAGADKFIIDSLVQAVEKDKQNPVLFTELGQAYRLTARSIDPAILGKGPDRDVDGLANEQEQALGSDPDNRDTNGNNITDGNEVLAGLNPTGTGQLPEAFLAKYVKINQENLIKAEEAFRKAIELKPDYALAYYQLALSIEQSGDVERAIRELENALSKLSSNIDFKFDLGRMYFNTGRVNEAARQFQDIVQVSPNHSNARYSLALSLERLGNISRALGEYRKVLELNPGNRILEDKIKELERALLAPKKS
ncbi:MAG: hypothetical protein A2751_00100 [Candidatus Doudnabacteria bacterium RIFCSPHIGHO2_01_FULL_46_14]|uniref:Uncharacterized protein n=1 Tax=Candidatus Doudnabacteria bacterium RIFCSPHIGHO2_01_FULL_46_14 TaxID=1817824 RepID=A0A1F5NNT8_9BACT|nr:MAG: hypothetical protein A2751_00100 [Candidatus Doudnabacteria bacterium RIFCSPHIGHO2_01_FULL_46_14]